MFWRFVAILSRINRYWVITLVLLVVVSANVALTLASLYPGATGLGLILDGALGDAQSRRRAVIVECCGLRDIAVAAAGYHPLAEAGCRAAGAHSPVVL